MKRILGLFIFNLFFTLSAYPQEVGDSVSNSSGPTKLRLFWKNVGFGKELFGKDNVGAIFRQAPVRSINGKIGAVTLNKTDVGLSNVNNTADINKPISALTQAALDAKEPLITPGGPAQYFTGSKTWANLDKAAIGLSNVVNLDQSNATNLLSGTIPAARFGTTTIPLTAIAQGGATSGQVISWNGTNWAAATMSGGGGGSGEANTASNVGVGGIGLFKQKTSLNLEFRNINSSGKLTVTLDAANNEVDLDIVDANLSIAGSQLTGTIPAARFGSLTVPPSAISQGGASTNQVLQWNGSAWTGAGLGTAAFLNVASSGNAATGEVVKGNDTRLTDSRTPTTHVHAAGDITTGTFSSGLFGNGTIATTKLAQTGATTGQAILWDGSAWNPGTISTGSGGEANTASNVNTAGIGVFNGKVGVDLQFKGVAAASTKVSVSNNTTTKTVDVDVVDSNLSIAGSQLTGTIPAARFGATTIPISAFNVTGTASSSTYLRGDGTWTALSGTGEVNTGSNVNTAGVGVYNGKVVADLQFKGIAPGSSKITTTNNTTNKTIDVDVVDANLSIAGSQLTGTIPAARMPAYTGDVTTSVGSVANTIANNAVTNAKAAQMAANTIKGNNTGSTANAVDMTVSQTKSLLAIDLVPNVDATNASNLSSGSIPSGRFGATTVPISSINATGTASSSTYLRGDGTWNTLSGVGETNTASNVGVGGVGIYKQKTGVNFDLRNINAGSNKIGVTLDAANNEVDIDVNQANLSIATTQLTGTLQAAQEPAHTGDVTNSAGSLVNTLATVNSNVGTFGSATQVPTYTVNGKGLITAASNTNIAIPLSQITASSASTGFTPNYNGTSWVASSPFGIDVAMFGAVYGSGVSAGTRTANLTALQNAVDANPNIVISGILEVSGTVTWTNKNIYLHGFGQYAIIRQFSDANLLVINQTAATTETNIFDLTLEAAGDFATGAAIVHNGFSTQPGTDQIYQKPFGSFRNLLIKGANVYVGAYTGWTQEWKKGIVLNVPNRITLRDITINGISGTNNTDLTVGIEYNTTRAAVETITENVQCVNVHTGFLVNQATTLPAMEGGQFIHCKAITVVNGFRILGSTAYRTPGWWIKDCHVAASGICIDIANSVQGFAVGNDLYQFGNSYSGVTPVFIQMSGTSDWHVESNKMYYQGGATPTNKPYGILIAGTSGTGNESVANFVINNYISLYAGDTKPGVWLQNYAYNNIVTGNSCVGPNPAATSVWLAAFPSGNKLYANKPEDILDGHVVAVKSTDVGAVPNGAWLSPINSGDITQGYNLDLSDLRGNFVQIPSSKIESNSYLKTVTMRYGQTVTLEFEAATLVQHNSSLFLKDNKNQIFFQGERLILQGNSLGVWEISRNINETDYNFIDVANGTSQTINAARSEVYSVYNNTGSTMTLTINVTNMKLGQQVTVKRYSDASTGPINVQITGGNFIQALDGGFTTSVSLPTTTGQRQLTWALSSQGYLELVQASASGGGGSTGVSTANTQTGTTYTLVSTDCGKTIIFNNASAITCTVPASVLTANCYVQWKQKGAGQVTFSEGAGLTLNFWQTYNKSGGQNAMGTIYYDSTTEATLGGQLSN